MKVSLVSPMSRLFLWCMVLIPWAHAFQPTVSRTDFVTIIDQFYFDDSSVIILRDSKKVYRSSDDGATWSPIELTGDDGESLRAFEVRSFKEDNQVAFIFTAGNKHFYTKNQGETWESFTLPFDNVLHVDVTMNYADHNLLLFNFFFCTQGSQMTSCGNVPYISKDGMNTLPEKLMAENLYGCIFAKSTPEFTVGEDSTIVCMQREVDTFGFVTSSQIISSSDYFKTLFVTKNPSLQNTYGLDLQVVQSFIVAVVKSDRYARRGFVDVYVSKDAISFTKALFDNPPKDMMYQVLPSTVESLNIVTLGYMDSVNAKMFVADVYKSDSSGLFFTKTIDNVFSFGLGLLNIVDVQELNGVWIASQVENIDEQHGTFSVKSSISFNDGDSWSYIKVDDDENCHGDQECSLNLLAVKERDGAGKSVTGPTPGLIMGVGTSGPFLPADARTYKTYISRNGGLSFKKALDYPSVYTFADLGNIIVAGKFDAQSFLSSGGEMVNEISFSLDQGDTWTKVDLGANVFPLTISTAPDGTSQKVLITAMLPNRKTSTFALDFSGAYERTCGEDDMEEWFARYNPETDDTICIDGYREKFIRRKQNADCFLRRKFEDIEVIKVPCACSASDVECSYGFIKDEGGNCKPLMKSLAHKYCSDPKSKKKQIKLTTKQMVPGNECTGSFEIIKNDFTLDCSDAVQKAKLENIKVKKTSFKDPIGNYIYLNSDDSEQNLPEETLLVLTESKKLFASFNGGSTFFEVFSMGFGDVSIVSVFLNPYFPNMVYVLTSDSKMFISKDRARSFETYKVPSDVSLIGGSHLTFNKLNSQKFIYYGIEGCDNIFSESCRIEASYTEDGGKTFKKLIDNVSQCHYSGSILDSTRFDVNQDLIICEQITSDQSFRLISSTEYFKGNSTKVLFDRIVGSAESGHFFVTAKINDDFSLSAYVTVDGNVFAEAAYPPDFHIDRTTSYTVLKSSSENIFLHVGTSSTGEFGALLKSNYNGTNYVLSATNVNRNQFGFVDYEALTNMEGILTINVVTNPVEVDRGETELLKTKMSHNDGGQWAYIAPPIIDSEGKAYSCKGKSLEECSLNLHSFTDRSDFRDTASSGSAIGMLFAVGNVGPVLLPKEQCSTFFSKDAGITWKEVAKGNYMWEFGDQGTILVIVNTDKPTNSILFSTDEGETWTPYQFTDSPVEIADIATVPSDTSRRISLLASNGDGKGVTDLHMIDFTTLYDRQCILNGKDPDHDDFETWTPKHPFISDNCLFGHVSHYLHRLPTSDDCFIGAAPIALGHKIERTCQCSRQDFECDYNYVLDVNDGTCKLIQGLKPQDHSLVCSRDPDSVEYWEPTGYRRIPLSTCSGGLELDKWVSHPCPGRESDYDKVNHSGLHGFNLFIVIFTPILLLVCCSWVVYDKGVRRNGGFARLGEIRLDDDNELNLIEENQVDKFINAIIKFGVFSFSAMAYSKQKLSNLFKNGFTRIPNHNRFSRHGDDFNDIIIDDENESLFRYDTDLDDDAREIDSFLEHGIANDIGDNDDDDARDLDFDLGDDHHNDI